MGDEASCVTRKCQDQLRHVVMLKFGPDFRARSEQQKLRNRASLQPELKGLDIEKEMGQGLENYYMYDDHVFKMKFANIEQTCIGRQPDLLTV